MTGQQQPRDVSRRKFLSALAIAGAGSVLISNAAVQGLQGITVRNVQNPLSAYPNRGWERVYRDLYHSDSSFTFLCAPNDTHNCLLRAFVKNGVVTRIGPTLGYGKATDLNGNRATARWDPRCCQKGLALVRRFYGDRRVKRPLVRKGFREWLGAGMPRHPETGAIDPKYLQRGKDPFVAVSWDEAFDLAARAMVDISRTYSGTEGQERLRKQDYDPAMVEATAGAGTQTIKTRGGMPALGVTRIYSLNRLCNSLGLLDDKLRGKGPDGSLGGRGWDSYSWHTDLPPGQPMVTGIQTIDFDLCNVEHAGAVFVWGMNWICTKMPDSHWLTEARMKGTRTVVIATEYSSTSSKADDVVIVRPGTTPALALGMAQVLIAERLFDRDHVLANTDLPLLVRTDTGRMLRASEVFADHQLADLKNNVVLTEAGQKGPAVHLQPGPVVARSRRQEWGDHVVWDTKTTGPRPVHRDLVGKHLAQAGIVPALEGVFDVRLADGSVVRCRTVFDATKEMLDGSYTPEQVEHLTWAPAETVRKLARIVADNKGRTLFALGMGPNQFFNNDLKDRAVLLVAALTRNLGHIGGNVGSYAGNYRTAWFNGVGQFIYEDPFDVEGDPQRPARLRPLWKGESAHYFNAGDRILRMGKTILTGNTHMPAPTKAVLVSNSNSLIGNAKGHYEMVVNTFKRVELVAVSEWWWTGSCEYADIVFAVDSWAEFKYPDVTASVTNPFITVFPTTPLPRIHDTRSDLEVSAGIGAAIGRVSDDSRHGDYWRFVGKGKARPYLQRILDHSTATRGYRIDELEEKAAAGIPAIMQTRTYPKVGAWEQGNEDKPWYTKTGRLEFYREEPEFQDSGENLVVHREPIDSTFFEPNVIVSKAHELLRPKGPKDYGVDEAQIDTDTRQARHVVRSVEQVIASAHPLAKEGYRWIFHTPKYRHGSHTTPVDTDIVAIWFGPFGDMNRNDPRTPFITEMYIDMNPADAKELGVEDGDYVWIDADPQDRPFRGWQKDPEWHRVARLMARARYYPGAPRGITRMWHNSYGASHGSVQAHFHGTKWPKGLAKSESTGYQSLFRTGSQQSCTRAWLKPTLMTDRLTVKGGLGQQMAQGFVLDVHCPTGAPREAMVKIERAEAGGIGGEGLWRPAALGLRPTYENEALKKLLAGDFAVTS